MVDLWNPLESIETNKPKTDYYLVNQLGRVVQIVKNDFGNAVKAARKLMCDENTKIQIIPRKGE
jgi:hypothetical protein